MKSIFFRDIDEDSKNLIDKIIKSSHIPNCVWDVIGNNKQKDVIKCLINDEARRLSSGTDFILIINELKFDMLQEESKSIIIEKSIAGISIDMDNDKIKKNPEDFKEYSGILQKYGAKKIEQIKLEVQQITEKLGELSTD